MSSQVARRILLVAAALSLCCASAARAVPGEPTRQPWTFQKATTHKSRRAIGDFGARSILELNDGSFLAFGDSEVDERNTQFNPVVRELRVMKINHFSSAGILDRRFEKSPVGRGITIGRRGELWYLNQIAQYSGDEYLAWGYTNGASAGFPHTNSSAVIVAFSIKTGRLIHSFGDRGIMRVGHPKPLATDTGYVNANTVAVTPLNDGRIAACGGFVLGLAHGTARTLPFVNTYKMPSSSASPFLASGSDYLDYLPQRPGLSYRDCRAIVQGPGGEVTFLGLQSTSSFGLSPVIWATRYLPDGQIDSSFGEAGVAELPQSISATMRGALYPHRVLVSADGKLYVAGAIADGGSAGFVARFDRDGTLHASFGNQGIVRVSEFGIRDMSLDENGDLLISGIDGNFHPGLGRLQPNGAWDANFFGTGRHVYGQALSTSFFQVSNSSAALMWNWIVRDGTRRSEKTRYVFAPRAWRRFRQKPRSIQRSCRPESIDPVNSSSAVSPPVPHP